MFYPDANFPIGLAASGRIGRDNPYRVYPVPMRPQPDRFYPVALSRCYPVALLRLLMRKNEPFVWAIVALLNHAYAGNGAVCNQGSPGVAKPRVARV